MDPRVLFVCAAVVLSLLRPWKLLFLLIRGKIRGVNVSAVHLGCLCTEQLSYDCTESSVAEPA